MNYFNEMLFYDDFVKNINEFNKNEFKDLEIFKLEFKKKLVWLCTGIPTIMISLYFAYVGYLHNYRAINIIFSILLMYMGCKHVFATLKYDIRINNKVGELIYEKMHIPFQEIESCTLRESSVGKKSNYQIVLSEESDLQVAASQLYNAMHQLDKMNLDVIIAERLPEYSLGVSMNDRLERASKNNITLKIKKWI